MSCNFHVGQRVVMAVPFDKFNMDRARADGVTLPVIGPVYTIRAIEPGEGWTKANTYLRFEEILNGPHRSNGLEPVFISTMFRPVVTRKSDISIFTAMLTGKRVEVEA